jgi:hypothetical protein
MTEEDFKMYEQRWENGAHVEVSGPDMHGRHTFRVPYAGDVQTLIAEIRRLNTISPTARDTLLAHAEHRKLREAVRRLLEQVQDCASTGYYNGAIVGADGLTADEFAERLLR